MVKWKGRVSAVILSAALVISNLNMTNVNASETPETVEQSTETDTSADTEKPEEEQEDEKTDSSSDETKGTGSAEEENTADNTEPGTNDPADTENTGENNGSADGSGSENSGEENNTEDKDDTDAEKEDDDKEGNSSEEDKTDVLTLPVQTVVSEEGKAVVNVPESVKEGDTFTVEASEGYAVKEVKVNGETVQAEDGVYTIANLSEEMTQVVIEVSVEAVTEENVSEQIRVSYTVTPENGAVVEGPQEVKKGEGFDFQVTAAEGYEITAVKNADTVLEPAASEEKVVEEAVSANDTSAAAQTVFTYHVDGTEEDVTISVEAKNLNETEENEEMLTFTGETTIGGVKAEVTVKTDDQTLKDASLVLGEEARTDAEKLNEYVQALEGDVEYSVAEEMPFDMHFEVKAEDSDEMLEKEPAADSKMEISISFKEGALTFGEDVDRVDLVHYEENNDVVEKVESIVSNVTDNSQVSVLSENTQLTYSEVSFEWNEFSTLSFVGLSEAETKIFPGANEGTYDYIPGNSKWKVEPVDTTEPTTDGILVDVSHVTEEGYILYTIPEGFSEDRIHLNASQDINDLLADDGYVPGDEVEFSIRLINNSDTKYTYDQNSAYISTATGEAGEYEETDPVYKYNPDTDTITAGWIDGAVGFDGEHILAYSDRTAYGCNRPLNSAIKDLYKGTDVDNRELSDKYLGEKLKEAGYDNGIEDLNHYFIDFYNREYKLSVTKIEDFPENVIAEIYPSGGKYTYVKETNVEVAETGYNWFYNRLVSLTPENEEEGKDYSIGSWMRDNAGLNEQFAEDLASLEKGQQYSFPMVKMSLEGKYMGNPYADFHLGWTFGVTLNAVQPPTPPVDPTPDPDPDEPEGGGGGTTTPPTETPAVLGERVPETGVLGERVEQPTEEQGVLGERRGAATSDNTPIGAWAVIAVMAAGGLTVYGYRRKKDIK